MLEGTIVVADDHGTIVVADDHEATRSVLGELLRSDGWTVLEARDGMELFELAFANHPDAVVADLAMPRMGGLRAARALRNSPGCAGEVMIAITGQKLRGPQEAAVDLVFDGVLLKPVRPEELRDALRRGLESAESSHREFPADV